MKVSDKLLRILAAVLASLALVTVIVCAITVTSGRPNTPTVLWGITPPTLAPTVTHSPTNIELLDLAIAKSRLSGDDNEARQIIEDVAASDPNGKYILIEYIVGLLRKNRYNEAVYAYRYMGYMIPTVEFFYGLITDKEVEPSLKLKLLNTLKNAESTVIFDRLGMDMLEDDPLASLILFTASGSDTAKTYLDGFSFLLKERYDKLYRYYERYSYDSDGNVLSTEIKDVNGTTLTKYFYEHGRIIGSYSEDSFNNETNNTYEYGPNGDLLRINHEYKLRDHRYLAVTEYSYDAKGRLSSVVHRVIDGEISENEAQTYTYDESDRLVSFRRTDYEGRLIEGTDYIYNTQGVLTKEYDVKNKVYHVLSFREDGKLLTRTKAGESKTVTYAYDDFGNLISESSTSMGMSELAVTYSYYCVYSPPILFD